MTTDPQTLCRTCMTPISYIDAPTGGWWVHETHPADEHDAVPGGWVDGDELMEAIAAEVWEHCAGEATRLVVDDPRNIAGTAAAVARRLRAVPSAPVGRADLRDRIAEALYAHSHPGWATRYTDLDRDERETYLARASAVLAVLPPPVDRGAVLREAADDLATAFGDPMAKHIGHLGAAHLRRRAREIESGQTTETRPETPLEKRLRYSERRNDELRAECKRRGKRVLEQSETIRALEREIDEVQRQLGAEILRAGQAEAELRRMADEAQQSETRPCGHDDYHDAHPWHERPDVWCPGIGYDAPAVESGKEA